MIDDSLHYLANYLDAPDWKRLGEHSPGKHSPVEWMEEAVNRTDATSIRHRRLPAEQVVWLMVASALYRHQSISDPTIRSPCLIAGFSRLKFCAR